MKCIQNFDRETYWNVITLKNEKGNNKTGRWIVTMGGAHNWLGIMINVGVETSGSNARDVVLHYITGITFMNTCKTRRLQQKK
jgi:hypothetical protein